MNAGGTIFRQITRKMTRWPNRILAAFLAAALFGGGLLGYAYFIEPDRLVVNNSTIKIKRWNPAFDGLRIAIIGDIHGGSNNVTEQKLRQIVALTNEQNADVIVLLGDYVSQMHENKPIADRGLRMPVETIAAGLAGLKAPLGVFAVLGNHDGWYDDERVTAALRSVGYKVLQNEVAIVERDGGRLRIYGMKDHLKLTRGWLLTSSDSRELLSTTGTGDVIVLQHSPDILRVIAGEFLISPDLRLILAAHTHGGQVWFPVLGTPIVPSGYGQKYAYGHVRDKNMDMFVTSGIGTSVLPIRFMMPPEIAILTIKAD